MQNHAIDPFGIVGQVLDGQFRVDRLVGEGGFSAVYRGYHLGLEEPIAIKCLKLPPSLSAPLVDQFAKRFRDESRILYRLSQGNLNVVRSIAAGTWQTKSGLMVPYMILEWLEGRSLANEFTIRRTVGQQGRSLDEVVKLFAPAADGLGHAHAQGVVHRDLNPGNLFLTSTPQGPRMKVLDFGVAKILDDSTLNIARTQTVGQIRIFAPAYGAPEQFDDTIGKVSAASDVYAFALILLEALRDRSVNDGQHLGEFAHKAIDPNVRPTPRSLGIDLGDEVEQIFARATKLDPRERWQSAAELWQALAIAASAVSQQKHAQAAMETPALGMPEGIRSTKTGMAPPPEARKGRMDKTMPLGAVFPKLGSPMGESGARAPTPEPDAPRDVTGDAARPSHANAATTQLTHGQPAGSAATGPVPSSSGTLRPAAGSPPSGGAAESGAPHVGTLMMAPGGFSHPSAPGHSSQAHDPHQRGASGKPLAMTLPLTGPHPLGAPGHGSGGGGPLPAAGAPAHPQSHPYPYSPQDPYASQANHLGQQPPMMQHHAPMPPSGHNPGLAPQAPNDGGRAGSNPTFGQQSYAHPGDSASMPPASIVPKKSNTVLWVVLVLGVVAVAGIAFGLVVVLGKGSGAGPSASASAAGSSASIPTAPPATATSVVADDAGSAAGDDAGSPASTASTADPAPTPTEVAPTPTPTPTATTTPTATATATATAAPVPLPVAVKDAGPPPDPNAFNEAAARSRLGQANGVLVFCKKAGGATGPGTALVTFDSDGSVSAVKLEPPYAGTPTGDCVTGHFKRTKVSSFQGAPHTLKHSFDVPK